MRVSNRFRVLALATAVLLALPVTMADSRTGRTQPQSGRGEVIETFTEYDDVSFDLDGVLAQRAMLHRELMATMVESGIDAPAGIEVSSADIAELDKSGELPVRVGVVRELGVRVSLAPLAGRRVTQKTQTMEFGAVRGSGDGGYVYTAAVESKGATGMRLHFTNFWLPESAELYLTTLDGEVFGPYTGFGPHGDGDFWSHTVMNEQVVLHLRHRGRVSADDLAATWFDIADVAHVGPQFVLGPGSGGDKSFCSYNASCIENASCNLTGPTVSDAIAHMQWISGPYIYICTGGLLTDTDDSSTIPHFLTANHCISRGKDAKNMEAFFQHTISCGAPCGDIFDTRSNHPQSLRTLGASIQSTNRTGDYTLMRLNEAAPSGSAYMGWSTAAVANSNNTDLHRFSHPSGAPQAYSTHRVNTSAGTCSSWPRGSWIYSTDTYGATEGGSSGSPVLNSAGQVVGQLSGACGLNPSNSCDNSNATVDGAFASYYGSVAQYLDNGGGSCTPSPEVCNNGTDDDCDGDTDCSDSDCTGDPACSGGTCGGHGDSCSSGADCCSNNCKRGSCKGN